MIVILHFSLRITNFAHHWVGFQFLFKCFHIDFLLSAGFGILHTHTIFSLMVVLQCSTSVSWKKIFSSGFFSFKCIPNRHVSYQSCFMHCFVCFLVCVFLLLLLQCTLLYFTLLDAGNAGIVVALLYMCVYLSNHFIAL